MDPYGRETIPLDAGWFDDSRIVSMPAFGTEVVLAERSLHRNYAGVLMYFWQFTTSHAKDPAAVKTPGLQWFVRCNGNPADPYLPFEHIVNPWGCGGIPISLRLDPGTRVQLVVRNEARRARGEMLVGGRILGRFWYDKQFGGRT